MFFVKPRMIRLFTFAQGGLVLERRWGCLRPNSLLFQGLGTLKQSPHQRRQSLVKRTRKTNDGHVIDRHSETIVS
jgi:hypothetical protein